MKEATSIFSGKHKAEETFVKNLRGRLGREIHERFRVCSHAEVRKDRSGNQYFTVEVSDKTGKIKLNYWGCSAGVEHEIILNLFSLNGILALKARVGEYKGELQLSMNHPERPILMLETDYFADDFSEIRAGWTQVSIEAMVDYIERVIKNIKHVGYKQILCAFWGNDNWRARFISWPAAKKHHHCYVAGLLEHTYEILKAIDSFICVYEGLDLDLLRAAAILHDTGKLEEYALGKFDIEYVEQAFMIGHMVKAVEAVNAAVQQNSIEIAVGDLDKLKHLILSHHGDVSRGFGSAVSPKLFEAKALAMADELSAKVNEEMVQARLRR